jgi:hypothetical protein
MLSYKKGKPNKLKKMIENFGRKNVCISKFLDHIKILFENFPSLYKK